MSIQDIDKLIRGFYALLDKGDMKGAMALISPDAEFKVIGMDKISRGHAEIAKAFESWAKAFPDMKSQVVNVIASENSAVVEELNRATHSGLIESSMGSLPATNRKIEVPAVSIFKLAGGKISSWSVYWLNDVMLNQLGYGPQKRAA